MRSLYPCSLGSSGASSLGSTIPLACQKLKGGSVPPLPAAGPALGQVTHCPIVWCLRRTPCCGLRSLRARPLPALCLGARGRWRGGLCWHRPRLGGSGSRGQLRSDSPTVGAVVQPGSGVRGEGQTGELPPGRSAPFHRGSPLFVLTSQSPVTSGQPAGWQGACCLPSWREFWMGEGRRGASGKSAGAPPSEERSVYPQASCSLAFLLLSLCSSGVGLLSTELSVYMECLEGVCHESVANRANQESWLVGEKTLTP